MASARRSTRYKALDPWRGVACVFVVIFHTTSVWSLTPHSGGALANLLAGWTRQLDLGVPMFFVISGYCISATAESARLQNLPVTDYFRRRFRRIFPPYWGAIALQCALMLLIDCWWHPGLLTHSVAPVLRPWTFTGWQWLGNLTLTETWRWHLGGGAKGVILGQSWTLCYEEQFYALTGLILLLAPRRFFAVAGLITLAVAASYRVLPVNRVDGFFFAGPWLMFAAGVFLYRVLNHGGVGERAVFSAVLAIATGYAFATSQRSLGSSLAFTAVLLFTHRWDARIAGSRWVAPAAFCGRMCYSLYLIHAPIARGLSQLAFNAGVRSTWAVLLVIVPLSLTISLTLAWLFHRLVEGRFLNPPRPEGVPLVATGARGLGPVSSS